MQQESPMKEQAVRTESVHQEAGNERKKNRPRMGEHQRRFVCLLGVLLEIRRLDSEE